MCSIPFCGIATSTVLFFRQSRCTPFEHWQTELDRVALPWVTKALSFRLKNDQLTEHLPSPFPFSTDYSPEITAAIASGSTTPRVVEITALARAAYAYKCYPTTEEFQTLAKETVKYECLAVGSGCEHYLSKCIKSAQMFFMHGLRILCCDYCLTTISSLVLSCFWLLAFTDLAFTELLPLTLFDSFLTTYHFLDLSQKLASVRSSLESSTQGWSRCSWVESDMAHEGEMGTHMFTTTRSQVNNYSMCIIKKCIYTCFTFLQGHILVGLKRRFKEFCHTPKHVTRVKPEPEWKENFSGALRTG